MRYAHLAAITAAREAGAILSFDPNLRFPLWPDREQLRQTVWQFLPADPYPEAFGRGAALPYRHRGY